VDSYTDYWYGFVLQDSMQKPDAPDNTDVIVIQASDGFGELQDQEWTGFDIVTPDASKTITEWMALIATKLPFTHKPTEGASSVAFQFASVWYAKGQVNNVIPTPQNADPLANTYIKEVAFVKVDDYGVTKGFTYYEILTYILECFNLQASMWNGSILIIQQNTYTQTSTRA